LPKSTTVRPSLLAHLFTAPLMLLVEFADPAYVIRNGVETEVPQSFVGGAHMGRHVHAVAPRSGGDVSPVEPQWS
jgi:hypothetical protein